MEEPLISIALCTYNGGTFLKQQLDSLLNQTYRNLELVITDDCSKDNTTAMLKEYAEKYRQIRLYLNDENLGYIRNFEKTIRLCRGDYIALSDQDDIWDPDKISILAANIGEHTLIYHDSAFIDESGIPLNKKLSDVVNCYSGSDSRVFLFGNCVLGHAMLFKRKLLDFTGKFNDTIIHDRWLAYAATNVGSIFYLDQSLVQYRQHLHANTNILKQHRANTSTSNSVEKLKLELAITSVLAGYQFNTNAAFKQKLLSLMRNRMKSYTSFPLAYFVLIHREVLFFFKKKSGWSKINLALKFTWGYKLKKLSIFNADR